MKPGRPRLPLTASNITQHTRQIAERVNSVLSGQIDCTVVVTLTPGATQTVLTDARISVYTAALAAPQTATAAAELASGLMWWICADHTLTINHQNAATADRTFTFALLG